MGVEMATTGRRKKWWLRYCRWRTSHNQRQELSIYWDWLQEGPPQIWCWFINHEMILMNTIVIFTIHIATFLRQRWARYRLGGPSCIPRDSSLVLSNMSNTSVDFHDFFVQGGLGDAVKSNMFVVKNGGFHQWGYPKIDGFCLGKSHWSGLLRDTPIFGNLHIWTQRAERNMIKSYR